MLSPVAAVTAGDSAKSKARRCGTCGGSGHNARSCSARAPVGEAFTFKYRQANAAWLPELELPPVDGAVHAGALQGADGLAELRRAHALVLLGPRAGTADMLVMECMLGMDPGLSRTAIEVHASALDGYKGTVYLKDGWLATDSRSSSFRSSLFFLFFPLVQSFFFFFFY